MCRSQYDDKKIAQMAKLLKECDSNYDDQTKAEIIEDLSINSDFELHSVCCSNPILESFKLEDSKKRRFFSFVLLIKPKALLFETSGKFLKMKEILQKVISEGSRVLIFSQMTRMLDIIEPFLDHLKLVKKVFPISS